MCIIFLIARQALREMRHSKIVWVFTVFLIGGMGLCEYISAVSLIEVREFQLAIFSNFIRWSAVILLLQFTVSSVQRELNEKALGYLLAMPLSRGQYILGKALGLAVLAVIFSLLSLVVLSLYQMNMATLAWLLSLYFELLIVICLALFIAVSLKNLAAAAAIAFYILCRALASIELLASQPLVQSSSAGQILIENTAYTLSYLLPALYQFADTEWLLYQQFEPAVLLHNILQSVVYCSLLLCATMFDLYRKPL